MRALGLAVLLLGVTAASPTIYAGGGLTYLTSPASVANLQTDPQVCVGTTATAVPATNAANRTQVMIVNQASASIYCSTSASVTASGGTAVGIPVAQGQTLALPVPSTTTVYCVAAAAQVAGTGCTTVLEVTP